MPTGTHPYRSASRTVLRTAILLLITLTPGWASDETAGTKTDGKSQTLTPILAGLKARQERLKTFHFTWDTRIDTVRGWPGPTTCLLDGVLNNNGRINNVDVEYTISPSELWGDGAGRLRDEFLMTREKDQQDKARSVRVRNLIDGTIRARVVMPLLPTETPMMTVWRDLGGSNASDPLMPGGESGPFSCQNRDVDLIPLLVALRPFNSASGLDVQACDVVDEKATVDRVPCIKLRITHRDPFNMKRRRSEVEFWWVDPKRDFIVMKWERRRQAEPAIAIEIDYKRDRNHVWIPSGWRQRMADLKDAGTLDATITHATINETLPADTFVRPRAADAQICDVTIDEETSRRLAAEMSKPATAVGASMEAIVAAWAKRQAKMRSFHIAWQSEWTAIYRPGANQPPRVEVRPEFQHFRSKSAEWIDGDRVALEQILIEKPKQSPVVHVLKCAYDGRNTRTFFAGDFWRVGGGQIVPGFDDALPGRIGVEPLMLAMRPLETRLSRIDPARCRVLPGVGKIDGTACTVICATSPSEQTVFYWLDPARDYVVVREYRTSRGRDESRVDLSYRADPTYGWVPTEYRRATVGKNGDFKDLTTNTIIQCEINSPLAASTFESEFPKGTETDELAGSPPRAQPAQAFEAAPQTAPAVKERPQRPPPPAKAP
jgi:hypothetical protein